MIYISVQSCYEDDLYTVQAISYNDLNMLLTMC